MIKRAHMNFREIIGFGVLVALQGGNKVYHVLIPVRLE